MVRLLDIAIAGCITIAIGASALAQQEREGAYRPSEVEILALVTCEEVVLGKQNLDAKLKSGIYDRLYGQWLIVGDKRDEIINCLVARYGWAALSTPDGRRGARALR